MSGIITKDPSQEPDHFTSKDDIVVVQEGRPSWEPFYSEYLMLGDKQIILEGMQQFYDMIGKQGYGDKNAKTQRFLDATFTALKYEGTERKVDFMKFLVSKWEELGLYKIAKAIEFRIMEADRIKKGEGQDVEVDVEEFISEEEEPAPETQRSLVAKILEFSTIFYKYAAG